MNIKQKWFRFYKNGYGVCATHKSFALFSLRNRYTKSLFLFDWYFYILKPLRENG